jgi:MoxR-like ATPase
LGITSWDIADGFHEHRPGSQPFPPKDCTTDTLLRHVAAKMPHGHILVLKDFHHSWNQKRSMITRKLRNMGRQLRSQSQYLVFTTPPLPPERDLPLELRDDVVVLQVPLPGRNELDRLFGEVTAKLDRSKLPRVEVIDKLVQSALGLTTNQARLAFSRVWAHHRAFDERGIELVTWAKREVIRESGALEFWPADAGEADVGGLDLMKQWLKKREAGFGAEAREAGLPFPRGVALIGIPGTGKSLSAKMLSGLWKLPLLRLDVGTLFGSLLGESERNMRKAIMLAETVSPCILWIDEMEKAFAGSGAASLNSGAATRVFGTFLTWMQEHRTPVFVIATANDVAALPLELMGRFDRTFFLDLPNAEERREIFLIHLNNAGTTFPERQFEFDELVQKSRGMVGREIERAVREAQFTAFADENREIEQQDLLAALEETVPISQSHTEVIENLRTWKTEGRAAPASSEEQRTGGPAGRIIET